MLQELRRRAGWRPDPIDFFHFRDRDDFEADIVLEGDGVVVGVELKAAATANDSDLRELRKSRGAAGKRCGAGVVLYDGGAPIDFGSALVAVPVRKLRETA